MDEAKQQTENLESEDIEQKNEETLKIVEPTLEEQLAAMKDQWLRSVAECENLRRRFEKEKEDALKYAATQFARDMIGITDFLEKALANDGNNIDLLNLLRFTQQQELELLQKLYPYMNNKNAKWQTI